MQLTPTPLANAFVTADCLDRPQNLYPLDLYLCGDCGHVQLLDVVDPALLFREYLYVSSTSPVFVEHFKNYAQEAVRLFQPKKDALVLEIGSNDGALLRFFKERGLRVLGIDPAVDIASRASSQGVETRPEFFTLSLARQIRKDRGPAAIIAANNVFAHADDLSGIVEGVRHLLESSGVFIFEVSYLADVVEKMLFDTIYHEHLSYHSLKPLVSFFRRFGLELFRVQRVPSHGGSLRCFVQLEGGPYPQDASLNELIQNEKSMGLASDSTFKSFAARLETLKNELSRLLKDLKKQGKSIAGYGAPAKATTLLFHFNLNEMLDFIVDDSALKQNRFSPGAHIPVLPSSAIYDKKPDYLVVLAWNFADSIIKNHQSFLKQKGHFIVPLPRLHLV